MLEGPGGRVSGLPEPSQIPFRLLRKAGQQEGCEGFCKPPLSFLPSFRNGCMPRALPGPWPGGWLPPWRTRLTL
eukprot:5390394-Alexandrium_andersonii.AAC.1